MYVNNQRWLFTYMDLRYKWFDKKQCSLQYCAFMRLCVYEGGLFFATSLRLVPPPVMGRAARFLSLETVRTATSPAMSHHRGNVCIWERDNFSAVKHIYVYVYICKYVYICVYIYTRMYIYIHYTSISSWKTSSNTSTSRLWMAYNDFKALNGLQRLQGSE